MLDQVFQNEELLLWHLSNVDSILFQRGSGLTPGMFTISQQEAERTSLAPHAQMSPHTAAALKPQHANIQKIVTETAPVHFTFLLKTSDNHVLASSYKTSHYKNTGELEQSDNFVVHKIKNFHTSTFSLHFYTGLNKSGRF